MSSVNESVGSIPRIIHQIWIQGAHALPPRYREMTATWARCNPGWTHRLWDEDALRALLESDGWWRIYIAQPEPMARADVARYALLQRFGGVYADVDTECRRSIEPMLAKSSARLHVTLYSHPRPSRTRYSDATNSFLASTPAHPLWNDVRERLQMLHDPRILLVMRTGPAMLSPLIEQHAEREPGDVHLIALPQVFTSAICPVPLMRGFSALHPRKCVLDFNDAGRAGVRRVLRAAFGSSPAASY
jgi:mannosyltransferase OCH1-like enzyme